MLLLKVIGSAGNHPSRCHPPNDFGIVSNQCNVDRITGVAA